MAAALVLMASCSGLGGRQAQVREAFEAWRDAAAAGDAGKTLRGMTAAFKSDWVFRLLNSGDALAQDWRVRLAGPARTDLDLWLEHQKRYYQGRAETLPVTVLAHPTFEPMLLEYFVRDREALKLQFSNLAVAEVYLDDTGATVTVRNAVGKAEMYNMTPEADGWKVDWHREAIRSMPR